MIRTLLNCFVNQGIKIKVKAQYQVGWCYSIGQGVSQDWKKAEEYFSILIV